MDRETIDRLDVRVNALGASLFFDEVTVASAATAGIDDVFALYASRAGVLGDVDAGQAASALAFFDPTVVADVWRGLDRFGTPSQIAEIFAAAMSSAATQRWDPDASRSVAALGMRVADSVTPTGLALFTGWRRVARARGDASSVVHALRELRGDIHIQCISVHGIYPLEAEMVTRGAPAAQLHGWTPPYPDPDPLIDAVAAAESATSLRMAQIYATALTVSEFDDLVTAVEALE